MICLTCETTRSPPLINKIDKRTQSWPNPSKTNEFSSNISNSC